MRYRSNAGSTVRAMDRATKHLPRIGNVLEVRATRVNHNEYIFIKGERGSVRLTGFCWGYHGEGPRGLVSILRSLHVPQATAELVFSSPRNDSPGVDWRLRQVGYAWSLTT